MKTSLIITSIAAPTPAMQMHAALCSKRDVEFLVIGDQSSPPDFHLDGCRFVSLEEQKKLPFRLTKHLPLRHYARKNIGYLMARQSDILVETDDDNLPRENFWFERRQHQEAMLAGGPWFNVYRCFTKKPVWPRGFPLERIHDASHDLRPANVMAPIQQGLADENPDVDAIYRMTQELPVHFEPGSPVALPENCWCPFNSQNTTWFREAFLLLYLPFTCTFRMTDIWRSFIAQRIAWTCGWSIVFHEATVIQKRNVHSLHQDFADEVPGYLHNANLCRLLEELDLKTGTGHIAENLLRCYSLLTQESLLDSREMKGVEAWIEDHSQ